MASYFLQRKKAVFTVACKILQNPNSGVPVTSCPLPYLPHSVPTTLAPVGSFPQVSQGLTPTPSGLCKCHPMSELSLTILLKIATLSIPSSLSYFSLQLLSVTWHTLLPLLLPFLFVSPTGLWTSQGVKFLNNLFTALFPVLRTMPGM